MEIVDSWKCVTIASEHVSSFLITCVNQSAIILRHVPYFFIMIGPFLRMTFFSAVNSMVHFYCQVCLSIQYYECCNNTPCQTIRPAVRVESEAT